MQLLMRRGQRSKVLVLAVISRHGYIDSNC